MPYPAMSVKATRDYVNGRRSGVIGGSPEGEQRGDKDDPYYEDVRDGLDDMLTAWKASAWGELKSGQAKDGLEGRLAVGLYENFATLPSYILTDRDFWRYCAAYLYEFVEWRNGSGCDLANYGAKSASIGRDCTPHRMFDRTYIALQGGRANGKTGEAVYESGTFGHTDLWRSHILRVLHGDAPNVAYHLVSDVQSNKLGTQELRSLAKHLQRVRANVLFQVLDSFQARTLVTRETARMSAGPLDPDGGSA